MDNDAKEATVKGDQANDKKEGTTTTPLATGMIGAAESAVEGGEADATFDDDDDDDEEEEEEGVGFEGWARVFFQARDDRSAQQILPTNSSTLARESHLFVVVDPDATELRLYPDADDLRLIVDPPIELKYFYAASVPGSQAGAALFLKEDDRQLRRYIFRFEFRNDAVLQPPSRPHQLSLSGKVAKYSQKTSTLKQVELKTKAAFVNQEDGEEMQRAEEMKSQEAHMTYLSAVADIMGDATVAADSFIGHVNSASEQDEGATWKRRPNRSWGPGYEDSKSVGGDQDAGSDYSSDFDSVEEVGDDENEDGDEDNEGAAGGKETLEQSFRRLRT